MIQTEVLTSICVLFILLGTQLEYQFQFPLQLEEAYN